ncbi:hypothetical protein AOQ84DRAFT_293558 [Glonium stellatum]|uniref:MJ1316 RNA cyclic group end recognition domain-containing protein n=1 Tax=Glonium stellatum TaxID=574774 RepID=A0A8E2F0K4_9PEZI|nr:hypothetical protein AOQ84DRAFT_293558 [Glonium stellatum]
MLELRSQQTTTELGQDGWVNISLTLPEPGHYVQPNITSDDNFSISNTEETSSEQRGPDLTPLGSAESLSGDGNHSQETPDPAPLEIATSLPDNGNHSQETPEDPNQEAWNGDGVEIEDLRVSPVLEPLGSPRSPEPVKPGRKLRTAKDVLSRLRWDSASDISNSIIAYKDQFKGNKEVAVEPWKNKFTDEEFILQHRIMQIKGLDNEVCWGREQRLDQVFYSGNS